LAVRETASLLYELLGGKVKDPNGPLEQEAEQLAKAVCCSDPA
jgi:hypothetical protein